jgi:hypothetical protein
MTFKWFATATTQQFTRWYFRSSHHRRRFLFLPWFLWLFVLAGYAMAGAIGLAVVLAIWIAQLFTTLGQLLWWPIHSIGS